MLEPPLHNHCIDLVCLKIRIRLMFIIALYKAKHIKANPKCYFTVVQGIINYIIIVNSGAIKTLSCNYHRH